MPGETHITALAHVIQLSIAPVFLLTGVATLLTVLTNRLGRIIDRARVLESQLATLDERRQNELVEELTRLSVRARLINLAINLCTICALLVCGVIAALFIGTFVRIDLSGVIGLVFIVAMLSLFAGLLSFLREIVIATRALRITWSPEAAKGNAKRQLPVVRE
jgi:hypothetical protein